MDIGKNDLIKKPGEIFGKPDCYGYISWGELFMSEKKVMWHVGDKDTWYNPEGKVPGIKYARPYYPCYKEYEKGDDIIQTLPLLLYKGIFMIKNSINANLKNHICQIVNHYLFIIVAYCIDFSNLRKQLLL